MLPYRLHDGSIEALVGSLSVAVSLFTSPANMEDVSV